MRAEVAADLRTILDAPDGNNAERLLQQTVKKYQASAPKLAEWLDANVPDSLAVM